MSNGCGSAGRVVASDTQGLRFKSSRPRILMKKNIFWKFLKRLKQRKIEQECPIIKILMILTSALYVCDCMFPTLNSLFKLNSKHSGLRIVVAL